MRASPSLREPATLVRGLGPVSATALLAGAVIGTGIFLSPSIVARQVGSPGLSLLVWLLCGFLALSGALSFAELGAALPRTGGTYAFLMRAYRQRWLAFLFGWSMFAVVLTGVMAAVATAFATYAGHFLDDVIPYTPLVQRTLAIGAVLFLTVVNCLGVRAGGRVQTVFAVIKVTAVVGLIVAGLVIDGPRDGALAPFLPTDRSFASALPSVGTAMIVALFAYNGWWYATFVAGEVRDPRRTLPVSIFTGMAIVLVVYILANITYLLVLPFDVLQASTRPAASLMTHAVGPVGAALISAAVMLSAFGTLNAQLLSVPRIYYAMARDGLFFSWARHVHPRFRTPALAIALQGTWASVLVLTGSYEQIIAYTAFPNYLFLSLGVLGLIVLRRREPELPRPYRVWGYPFTPVLFLLLFSWYLFNSLVHATRDTLVGVGLTLTGIPFYLYWSRHGGAAADEEEEAT